VVLSVAARGSACGPGGVAEVPQAAKPSTAVLANRLARSRFIIGNPSLF